MPLLADPKLHGAADHQGGELGVARGRRALGDHLAPADDRDVVGDGLDLPELVRDEDDRVTAVAQLAHDHEQVIGLAGSEHGRGLVQDQDAGVPQQRFDDLDPLLHAHRKILDVGIGVDAESEALRQLSYRCPGPPPVQKAEPVRGRRRQADLGDVQSAEIERGHSEPPDWLRPERDVLRDGEDRDEHEVLVHHAHAGADRVLG